MLCCVLASAIGDVVRRRSGAIIANVGAQYIVKNSEQYLVRSVGLARDMKDLATIVLKVRNGTAVYVRDVATIGIGGEVRQGLATRDGRGEAVAGLVLKLIGTNTSKVVADVKAKLKKINKVLPAACTLCPITTNQSWWIALSPPSPMRSCRASHWSASSF